MTVLYTQVNHLSELPEQDTNSVTDALLHVLDDLVQAAENARDRHLHVRPRQFNLYASRVRRILQNARVHAATAAVATTTTTTGRTSADPSVGREPSGGEVSSTS